MSTVRESWEVITTVEQLDALPVGSVVMALWSGLAVPNVFTRYGAPMGGPGGWHDSPRQPPLYPLGSGRNGETVLVLWHPAWASALDDAAVVSDDSRRMKP